MPRTCRTLVTACLLAAGLCACDARFDAKTGSGSPASAPAAAASRAQLDPH